MTDPDVPTITSKAADDVLNSVSESLKIPVGLVIPTRDGNFQSYSSSTHHFFTSFCHILCTTEAGDALCRADSLQTIKNYLKSSKPTIHRCHAGLVNFAVPIRLDRLRVGVIYGGQFREVLDDVYFQAKLNYLTEHSGIPYERLRDAYMTTPLLKDSNLNEMLSALTAIAKDFERTALTPPHYPVEEVLEQVRELTPDLISYLKVHSSDLIKLNWEVFEHLIAEFFAGRGCPVVRLVGKTSTSAADIFAVENRLSTTGTWKYFIEVKRWKDRVGIEVVDRVYGAMLRERGKWGWHVAMICSVTGFADFRAVDARQLQMRGIELLGKEDISEWLRAYRHARSGLWLPKSEALRPIDPQAI